MASFKMIETRALTKTFGLKPVLRGVDLNVAAGECVALFGPNGAGKTTLLRILATLTKPSLGMVKIAGGLLPTQAEAVRQRLGMIAHQPLMYGDLTAEENLQFYAKLYGLREAQPRIIALLERVGLGARRRDVVRTFSRGMHQRLAIARALLHAPPVYLMDEPYTGLDPTGTALLDEIVRELVAQGASILMTTHSVPHGLALADRAVLLAKGKIIFSAPRGTISAADFQSEYERAIL